LLTSHRRNARVKSAAFEALKELAKLGFGAVAATSKIQKDVESLLRGQTSLAEYPHATLLTSVSANLCTENPVSATSDQRINFCSLDFPSDFCLLT